jgi:hypothetical protein
LCQRVPHREKQLLLLGLGQIPESPGHAFRLAVMSLDGVPQRQRSQVEHVSGPHPQITQTITAVNLLFMTSPPWNAPSATVSAAWRETVLASDVDED